MPANSSLSSLLLSVAGVGLLVGVLLSAITWLRFRKPDVPLSAIFISPLFVASPSYFQPEGQRLRRLAARALAVSFFSFLIFVKLNDPTEL